MPELTPAEAAIMNELTAQPIVEKAMKADKAKQPVKPKKTCDIKDMLPPSAAKMLEQFPTNATIRSVALVHLKRPIPDELDTFPKIREWIETTFEKEKPAAPALPSTVDIPISGTEYVSGTCEFSGRRVGHGTVSFTAAELLALIHNADDLSALTDAVYDEISERGGADLIGDMDTDDDGYDYNNHDVTDARDSDWVWRSSHVAQLLADAVRRIAPERAREWGL